MTALAIALYLLGGIWPFTAVYLDDDGELAASIFLAVFWPIVAAAMIGAAALDGLFAVWRRLNGRGKGQR